MRRNATPRQCQTPWKPSQPGVGEAAVETRCRRRGSWLRPLCVTGSFHQPTHALIFGSRPGGIGFLLLLWEGLIGQKNQNACLNERVGLLHNHPILLNKKKIKSSSSSSSSSCGRVGKARSASSFEAAKLGQMPALPVFLWIL